jgi:hypothetical protein
MGAGPGNSLAERDGLFSLIPVPLQDQAGQQEGEAGQADQFSQEESRVNYDERLAERDLYQEGQCLVKLLYIPDFCYDKKEHHKPGKEREPEQVPVPDHRLHAPGSDADPHPDPP